MTILEFKMLCDENLISTEIALENEDVINALKDRDDNKVKELLLTEF